VKQEIEKRMRKTGRVSTLNPQVKYIPILAALWMCLGPAYRRTSSKIHGIQVEEIQQALPT
jgi:hypothetical protein